MKHSPIQAPPAQLTLRAHYPAPARVELAYRPLAGRLGRTLLSLLVFWGAIPLLMWVPPHYPWVLGAFTIGAYLAFRSWTGKYRIYSFAGICPRCGEAITLGVERTVNLPHTLTCYHCHFEPLLEVNFHSSSARSRGLEHCTADCVGSWRLWWLADEAFMVCDQCHAHRPATPETRRRADQENERSRMLMQLTREGRSML